MSQARLRIKRRELGTPQVPWTFNTRPRSVIFTRCNQPSNAGRQARLRIPLSSECGTSKTAKARFWPWISGKSPLNVLRCCLFARKRLDALPSTDDYIKTFVLKMAQIKARIRL